MSELAGRWNYYFLRYGAGTIVGALIAAFFVFHFGYAIPFFQSHGERFELRGVALTLFLVFGFAYCYIASAPGTVFHAARGLFWNAMATSKDSTPQPCILLIALLAVALGLVVSLEIVITDCCYRFYHWFCFRNFLYSIFLLAGGIVLALQWILIIYSFLRFDRIASFYSRLTEKRAKMHEENSSGGPKKNGTDASEFVESYRDLREHGNAFEIILLEICLAITLLVLRNCFPLALFFLVLWILPAALCWIVGSRLEFHFMRIQSDNNGSSLSKSQ